MRCNYFTEYGNSGDPDTCLAEATMHLTDRESRKVRVCMIHAEEIIDRYPELGTIDSRFTPLVKDMSVFGTLLWELLCAWYRAESELAADPLRFPPLHAAPFETIVQASAQRVIDVITGEVCWSNTTPGDRMVWLMRTRMDPEEVSLFLKRQKKGLMPTDKTPAIEDLATPDFTEVEPLTDA